MAVRRADEQKDGKTILLRVTIPKKLMNDIRQTKKECKENGLVFDIKPDVWATLEKAVAEARAAIKEVKEGGGPKNARPAKVAKEEVFDLD